MRLHIGLVAVIVVAVAGLLWYASKHYHISKIAGASGASKETLVKVADGIAK